ncbi:hypothetical protein VCRA2119O430_150066 [Vibrio crassostreae]|nr:hypothetical protein VCRA2113O140_130136 [Vibrio crassostreae]CAK1771294.1 hypothetical protein VCRA2119O430_150066 [Vibrio crassostreae]CAK1777086.1 hypothetical protein VCRA2117O428_150075 [Vibrio crassostreae]CAK2212320.1 hypothetical protein VCRA2116E424_100054 [Vibrio crassostreae]CAK2624748.1 hypothetical protein VCRA2128O451_140075 [Vibrio crassostreae]
MEIKIINLLIMSNNKSANSKHQFIFFKISILIWCVLFRLC